MAQTVSFTDPNNPKQLLLEINEANTAEPVIVKIYKCSFEELVALKEACIACEEWLRKHMK
jgi:hypothetical protein